MGNQTRKCMHETFCDELLRTIANGFCRAHLLFPGFEPLQRRDVMNGPQAGHEWQHADSAILPFWPGNDRHFPVTASLVGDLVHDAPQVSITANIAMDPRFRENQISQFRTRFYSSMERHVSPSRFLPSQAARGSFLQPESGGCRGPTRGRMIRRPGVGPGPPLLMAAIFRKR